MSLEKLVAVSGKGGVFKMVGNRSNGLVLQDLDTGKKSFASSRIHQFTPLESISIYTEVEDDEQTVSLAMVFSTMLEQLDINPPISVKAGGFDIRNYFKKILPNHDKDKVMLSDIKKIIKWFNFLNERSLISIESLKPAEKVEKVEEAETTEEVKTEA